MACPDLAYYTSLDGVNYALLCNHFEMLYNRHYVGGSPPASLRSKISPIRRSIYSKNTVLPAGYLSGWAYVDADDSPSTRNTFE